MPVVGVAADELGDLSCSRRTENRRRLATWRLLMLPRAAAGLTSVAVRFVARVSPSAPSASARVRRTARSAGSHNSLCQTPSAERAPPARRRGDRPERWITAGQSPHRRIDLAAVS